MYSSIRHCLFPRDDTANPQEMAGGSHTQPVPFLQQPGLSAENISAPAEASPGNGITRTSTSDLDLGNLGNQMAAAIRKGDLPALNNLLNLLKARGINPNLCDKQGHYPLYWVSGDFRVSNILKTLLDYGVDPNICTIDPYNDKEHIPLLQATRNGSYEVSKALLKHGANPQAHDRSNFTALHWATWGGSRQRVMLLKCLLDHGADINARNDPGRTPLCCAIIRGDLVAVNILLDEGADPNIPDKDGCTALDHAVFRGHTNMVDDLLAHGANPDTPGDKLGEIGWSNALYEALRGEKTDIVNMLLDYGANPDKVSIKGDPPLHMAIEKSNAACVDMLLAYGANPNICNQSGETALKAAKAAKSPPRIINALDKPFNPVSLQICARNCIRATLIRPQMTPEKTRFKPLSKKSQDLPLPDSLRKYVSNPLTL